MVYTRLNRALGSLAALAVGVVLTPATLTAVELQPSSHLLVPYFEVVLDRDCRTTVVAVGNDGPQPVDVVAVVYSNWGIPLLEVSHRILADEVWTFNLGHWLLDGNLPDRTLGAGELAGLQAALAGEPVGGLYYGTARSPDGGLTAVGYVTVSARGEPHRDVLWGDYFVYCPHELVLQGETLVDIDPDAANEPRLCRSHAIRFLDNGQPYETELMVWTPVPLWPSDVATPPVPVPTRLRIYDEGGRLLGDRELDLLPADRIDVGDLALTAPFGWLVITSPTAGYVTGHYTVAGELSSSLHAWCLPLTAVEGPAIALEKLVQGAEADVPPGPAVAIGAAVSWTFVVTNTGAEPLTSVTVEDPGVTAIACPRDVLAPGEAMTCTAAGAAIGCQQHNVARVVGHTPAGAAVEASDGAYYFGTAGLGLDLEARVQGEDADAPPGPQIVAGQSASFTYLVTNIASVALADVALVDDQGLAVSCPQDALAPGEAMTCTAATTALPGQRHHVATATANAACESVRVSDPAFYLGWAPAPAIDLEKLVDGVDADLPPGPSIQLGARVQWTYVVTNIGDTQLDGVAVVDDQGVAVACPKATLMPGEAMTCTAHDIARACQYVNLGTVTGMPAEGSGGAVTDQDASHYYGRFTAALSLEKRAQGEDADVAPGPYVRAGEVVQWSYTVTNTGEVPLTGVLMTDERLPTCASAELAPGAVLECGTSTQATVGTTRNEAAVIGVPPCGAAVEAADVAYYHSDLPRILLEKLTNGQDADTPPGPFLLLRSPVLWSYVVTNGGDTGLTEVAVTDDRGVAVTCPKAVLAAGESMTCTASGTAVAGQYANVGTATGTPPEGAGVAATDPSHYFGYWPQLALEKRVNGQDADTPPGPSLLAGSAVQWTFMVTNTGDVRLTAVQVSDDRLTVTCPKAALDPGEAMTCTASGIAVAGQWVNVATASGNPPTGPTVTATDQANYRGVTASVSLQKLTNGEDADAPPGPTIAIGAAVLWAYVATNTGDVAIAQLSVTDNRGVTVTCPKTTLQPGETMTCTAGGTAVAGQYSNVGTVTGQPEVGPAISAQDPSHYYGWSAGNQGCTPGYWKNHTDSWPPTGYSVSQKVLSVFAEASRYPSGNAMLLAALGFGGGSGVAGAAEILLRAGVAALLNATHPDVAYPRLPATVVTDVDVALASGSRDTMLSLAAALDADNNLGCPLH